MYGTVRRESTAHAPRPLGVWLLTILNSVVAGIFPLVAAVAVMGGNATVPGTELTALLLAGLGIGVIGAAIGTWQGNDSARIVLLALLVLFHGLSVLGLLLGVSAEGIPDREQARVGAGVFRSIFWLAINLWYFLRPKTRDWFRG
jgi:hypothetical protein